MNDPNTLLYVAVFLLTLIPTIVITKVMIPILKRRAEQPIYTDGPSWHAVKTGTPTMGGISFLIAIAFALLTCSLFKLIKGDSYGAASLLICVIYSLLNGAVGIIDDITKLYRKKNAGLSARAKLLLQFLLSSMFLLSRKTILSEGTILNLPFGTYDFGAFYYIITLIILVGITNCANLTDGIDGLSSSVAFAISVSTFYFSYGVSDTASFICASLAAGTVGFLVFNLHPAKIFMGDTGSLFIGSLVGALAFELGNPIAAILSGGVYVIEGISVILQVLFYKLTKKRLFKMAPLHHHLERCGWDENKICITAIILTLFLSSSLVLICGV